MKLVLKDPIEDLIFVIRGQRVMLDRDLALLYQVTTKALNQAVKRNTDRFPQGFMFRLNQEEFRQLVTNCDRFSSLKHASHPPLAFTDYGVAMLSSVLRSEHAVKVNIEIIRVFIKLRTFINKRDYLTQKIDELEKRVTGHDQEIRTIFDALRELINSPKNRARRIGFHTV
ncbi:MAG: ORF6N domain-containing protein [Elusimicrobiota bacterium]